MGRRFIKGYSYLKKKAYAKQLNSSERATIALAWCVGIIVVAYFFAMGVYKKRA